MKMTKRIFDSVIIVIIALFLIGLAMFDLLEASAKFMLIPILIFYFIGQYAERKFQKRIVKITNLSN